MGLYSDRVLPRVIDWMMDREPFERLRRRHLAGLEGEVLEVGFGSGLNLPYYPPGVTRLLAVEPSRLAVRLARDRIAAAPFPVEIVAPRGEDLPLDDASVDGVASTWTLCSIAGVARALQEIHRVLAPAGSFHFVEHGLSPEPWVARLQRWLTPVQKRLGGGCHLDRRIDRLIADAGFTMRELETFYMRGPKIGTWIYAGVAVREP